MRSLTFVLILPSLWLFTSSCSSTQIPRQPTSEQESEHHLDTLSLTDAEPYSLERAKAPVFALEHRLYKSYQLRLENKTQLGLTPPSPLRPRPAKARLECDADIYFKEGFLFSRDRRARVYEFDWYNSKVNGQEIKVGFSPRVQRCVLQFKDDKEKNWSHALELRALETLMPSIKSLTQKVETCAIESGLAENTPEAFFWGQDFEQNSCPQPLERLTPLPDPIQAFNAKLKALTGSELLPATVQLKNPKQTLDFSKAPRFDMIWVSSLNFSADFYGSILAKILRFHAARGTQVRILVPRITTALKDRRLVESIARGLPSVKIQFYRYDPDSNSEGRWLDKVHRVNHSKILLGFSEANPSASFLITGGRNIRDSSLFYDRPGYKLFPWLKNYLAGEEDYIYYDDFEMEFKNHGLVRSALSQMLALWSRDSSSHHLRTTNLNVPRELSRADAERILSRRGVRHLTSVPFLDGQQLEKYYVQMLDSAQSEILLTTPYFHPTPVISDALLRARERGVRIKILTRIVLKGDGTPALASDANRIGVNQHLSELDLYEWTDEKSILHSKLLVIDAKLSFVSSVNLNNRSFYHDIESGVLILDPKTAAALRAQIQSYLNVSRKLTRERKTQWLNGFLLDWMGTYF